jgi:hypothetical protein
MIAADSQQRFREQGELMPGDCGGRLKKEKRMVISALSLFVVLTFARGMASDASGPAGGWSRGSGNSEFAA